MIAFAILIKRSDDNKSQNIANLENTKKVDLNLKPKPNKLVSQSLNNPIQSDLNKSNKFTNNNSSNSSRKNDESLAKILNISKSTKSVTPAKTSNNDLQINRDNKSANSLTNDSERNFMKTIGDIIEKTSNNIIKSSTSKPTNNIGNIGKNNTSILSITNTDSEVTIFFLLKKYN